jgi:hypothetical protein
MGSPQRGLPRHETAPGGLDQGEASKRRHSMPELCFVVWTALVPFDEIAR